MQRGFSLVELSIVLVILGLLTGGILAGQSLIRAAELRSATMQLSSYQTAFLAFRDRYMALPGDMPNAQKFWGIAASCPGTVGSTDATTCNGNGDGKIGISAADGYGYESFRVWQHLANSGLIEGQYSGIGGTINLSKDAIPGVNVPAGRFGQSGFWSFDYWNLSGAYAAQLFAYDLKGLIGFGARLPGYEPSGEIMTPEEAWSMDIKLDDGQPARGRFLSNVSCSTATTNMNYDATYLLTSKSKICSVMLREVR